jgi:hypothetical protein
MMPYSIAGIICCFWLRGIVVIQLGGVFAGEVGLVGLCVAGKPHNHPIRQININPEKPSAFSGSATGEKTRASTENPG